MHSAGYSRIFCSFMSHEIECRQYLTLEISERYATIIGTFLKISKMTSQILISKYTNSREDGREVEIQPEGGCGRQTFLLCRLCACSVLHNDKHLPKYRKSLQETLRRTLWEVSPCSSWSISNAGRDSATPT